MVEEVPHDAGIEIGHFQANHGAPLPLRHEAEQELHGVAVECGLIGEKHAGMQMASIGPSMWDVHTPDERVSISSVQQFWTLLAATLARI